MDYAPRYEFQKCVACYRGDYQQKGFSCWDQFLAMAFAQLTYRESLRDIEACLRALGRKRYHMGFRSKVARTTLADANERRDWRIYADFAQVLIGMARPLYAEDPIGVELDQGLYALDSTTIDLCLSQWARFRHKAATHTLLASRQHSRVYPRHRRMTSTFPRTRSGCLSGIGMDRAYIDFERLFLFSLCSAFFVVRAKNQRRPAAAVLPSGGHEPRDCESDQTVILTTNPPKPIPSLRRISYFDAGTNKRLKLLTNNSCTHHHSVQVAMQTFLIGSNNTRVLLRHQRECAQIWSHFGLPANPEASIDRRASITILEKQPILQTFHAPDSPMNSKILAGSIRNR